MDVFSAIQIRRSIRHYLSKSVEEEKLIQVLNAGHLAPSAKNRQEWFFIIVQDRRTREKLAVAAMDQQFVAEAPVVIVCCASDIDYMLSCGHPGFLIDTAIAIDHMTLAAVALGLGTCWIGAFNQSQVKSILNIPDFISVVELLTLGYPDEDPKPRPRKSLHEVVKYERWI